MINFETFQLENGLRVVFNQDKNTTLVAVNLLYEIGAKHEQHDQPNVRCEIFQQQKQRREQQKRKRADAQDGNTAGEKRFLIPFLGGSIAENTFADAKTCQRNEQIGKLGDEIRGGILRLGQARGIQRHHEKDHQLGNEFSCRKDHGIAK